MPTAAPGIWANPAPGKDASGAAFGNVVGIAAQDARTMVCPGGGTVWSWGSNVYLQLGGISTVSRRNPMKAQLPQP